MERQESGILIVRVTYALLCIGAFLFIFSFSLSPVPYPEVRELSGKLWQGDKHLFSYFEELARNKGGVYAFNVLRAAELPPNADLHLLGHVIGDELYAQKGIEAMVDCTQDFRNACSHAVVVGAFNDFGEDALLRIQEACKKAPGGSGAYTMCFHGLGHGVFAYWGYELPATINTCRKTGTGAHGLREYEECVGGVIMELMGGGEHDKAAWYKARNLYLNEDPLSPCSGELVPEEVKDVCYLYLTPRLFEYAGADLSWPREEHFSKAFQYCDRIPTRQDDNRKACFGGMGKEFIVLALNRDIRVVEKAGEDSLKKMWEWCGYAPHREALSACFESVVGSLYWGGENAPDAALSFCKLSEESYKGACLDALYMQVNLYNSRENVPYREELCAQLSPPESARCTKQLLLERS